MDATALVIGLVIVVACRRELASWVRGFWRDIAR